MSPAIREIILKNGDSDKIKREAIKEGMNTLRMCALTKVALVEPTLDEAVSTSSSDKF